MMNLTVTAANWEELRSRLEESKGDEFVIEDINVQTEANLDIFIERGYDIQQIVEMLSREAIMKNYDKLVAAHAVIDLLALFDSNYVFHHVEDFIARGCSAADIVKKIQNTDNLEEAIAQFSREYWPDLVEFVCKLNDVEIITAIFHTCEADDGTGVPELLKVGVDPREILGYLHAESFSEGTYLCEILEKLIERGVSKDEVDKWLKGQDYGQYAWNLESIITDKEWKKVIKKKDDFIDLWLTRYGRVCLRDWENELPKNISFQRFIDHFSIDEIEEMFSDDVWKDAFEFKERMEKEKCDLQAFADRFKVEVGDPRNDKDLDLLNNLSLSGIKTGMEQLGEGLRIDDRAPGVIFIWFSDYTYPVEKDEIRDSIREAISEKKISLYDINKIDEGDIYLYYNAETSSREIAMTAAQNIINTIKCCYQET